MSCNVGEEFEASAWVSAQYSSPIFTIGVQYERLNGDTSTWTGVASHAAPTTAVFLKGYWVAPADARRVRLWCQINTVGTENPWHITDAQLRRTDSRTAVATAAIQTEATTRASQTGELFAQYTVKLDVGGKVSGFGLASSGPTGTGSVFEIRAGKFAIAADTGSAAGFVPFQVLTAPTVIDGVTLPAGAYATNAFIQNLQVTNAKIAALAVDDGKVANLSAAKLTIGDGTVGGNLRSSNHVYGSSGWIIRQDGYAELNNVVVRGTVYATAGQIGGITIASNAVRAGQTAYNTGTGFYLGADGKLSIGSGTGNKLTWDGANLIINSPGLNLSNGSATFSGSLTAEAVNAVDTINLKGNAVTIPLAATGADLNNLTTTWVSSATVVGVFTGEPVVITISAVSDWTAVVASSSNEARWRLMRNGGLLSEWKGLAQQNSAHSLSSALLDTPPSGENTYTVQFSTSAASGAEYFVRTPTIIVIGYKR